MSEQFLYQELAGAFRYGAQKPEIPESITRNLNPAYPLRPYQEDALAYFIHYFENDDFSPNKEIPDAFVVQHGDRQRQDADHGRIDSLSL